MGSESNRSTYVETLRRAASTIAAGNLQSARRTLEETTTNSRDFIWNYLHNLCDIECLRINASDNPVHHVSYSPDAKRLLSTGKDGMVHFWNAETGAKVHEPMRAHLDENATWQVTCPAASKSQLAAMTARSF